MRLTFDDLWNRALMAQRLQILHAHELDNPKVRLLAYGDIEVDEAALKALDEDAARVERLRRQHAEKESTP